MNTFEGYVYEPVDLCAIYEPLFEPLAEQAEEWRKQREAVPKNPFSCTVSRKIGNTWYSIDTECNGSESLTSKVRRLIFSDREAI